MFVYNSKHPAGAETGIDIPDRLALATKEQNEWIGNRRAAVDKHERDMLGNASPLPRDVWGEWDREGIEVQREVLSVFGDIASAVGLAMPIGKLVHYFQQISDSGSVNVSLDGRSKAKGDQPIIQYQGTPLPLFDSSFSYGWRQMSAAATEGFNLDGAARRNAMFKVAESLELMTLNGRSDVVVAGAPLYGLTNHPKRSTRVITGGTTLNGGTGAQWLTEVNATAALLHAANFRVPFTLYLNWDDWYYATSTDFSTAKGDKTIAQRLMEISMVREVVPASKVTANSMIALVKDSRSVQMLNAMPMSSRQQFRANPEDDYNYVVMAAQALEIKYDYDDNCGLALTTAT
jgi:hypothetical protein